ncbi:hypothetical protein HN011_002179, partial [Eciton burchellii]
KQNGTRSEKKTKTFAMYLSKIFKSNQWQIILEKENKLLTDAVITVTIDASIMIFTVKEVRAVIKNLNPKKTVGYLITNHLLQKLPGIGIKFIIQLYNTVFRRGFFPPQ